MSALFLKLDRTGLFLSSPLAPHGEVGKALPVVRLATKKLLVSVDAVVGLELFFHNACRQTFGHCSAKLCAG